MGDEIVKGLYNNRKGVITMQREKFEFWMEEHSRAKKSIYKYSSAIETISSEIIRNGYHSQIYAITVPEEIDHVVKLYNSIPELKQKNKKGNNMYTCSLQWYKKYLEYIQKENTIVSNIHNDYDVKDYIKERGSFEIINNKKMWKRDRRLVESSIDQAQNLCEYNLSHKSFICNRTGKAYMEGHHLIPMKYQDRFENSLDVEANIVCLCVNCHKKLHHGILEDKISLLNNLYKQRIVRLQRCGVDITKAELIELYKDND